MVMVSASHRGSGGTHVSRGYEAVIMHTKTTLVMRAVLVIVPTCRLVREDSLNCIICLYRLMFRG